MPVREVTFAQSLQGADGGKSADVLETSPISNPERTMAQRADEIIDRRRLRRKLTFWRVAAILIAALAIEVTMAFSNLIAAFTTETFDPEGITVSNVFGSKFYAWKDLERFEILWDYEGKRLVKKEEVDAPYILLKFANTKKKLRFDYLEAIDQCIRANYGEPHKDDWTNIGK